MAIIRTSNTLFGQPTAPVEYVDISAAGALTISGSANLGFVNSDFINISATGVLQISGSAYVDYYDPAAIDLSASGKINIRGSADLQIATEPAAPYFPAFRLNIAVDSSPEGEAIRQPYEVELKIDDLEVEARSVSVDADPRGIGKTINVTLADINQRNLLNDDSHIELNFKTEVGNSWKIKKLIDSNKLTDSSYSISFNEKGFSFSAGDTVNKLTKNPKNDFTLYDPNRITLNQTDFPVFFDNFGRSYRTQLVGIGSLSLYRILREITARCGFTGFHCYCDDFLIERIDFNVNTSYLDSLAGSLGMFRPVIREENNYLIIDPKVRKVSGSLPNLRKLRAETIESLSIQQKFNQIDGLTWNYTSNELEGSLFRSRNTFNQIENDDGSKVQIDTRWHDFYNEENPNIVIASKIVSRRTTTLSAFLTIRPNGEVVEEFQYDRYMREIYSSKTMKALVPPLNDLLRKVLDVVSTEIRTTVYKVNPFSPRTQYIALKTLRRTGTNVIAEDEYQQPYVWAYIGGNIVKDMRYQVAPQYSEYKVYTPMANGQTSCLVVRSDDLQDTLAEHDSEISQGDASIQTRAINGKMYIFPTGSDGIRRGNAMPDFATGSLPVYQGKKLVQIECDRQGQGRNRAFNVSVVGFDDTIEQGDEFALYDDEDVFVANIVVVGYKIQIEPDSVKTQLLVEEF